MVSGRPFVKGYDPRRNLEAAKANMQPYVPGPTHPKWNGGITEEYAITRNANMGLISNWSKAVRARDNNTCCECGAKDKPRMAAHHIKSMLEFPELAYDVDNGVTYCNSCHGKLHWRIARERNN